MTGYARARDVTRYTAEMVRPPRRMSPSQAARALRTEKGPWDPELAPMLVEPLDALASRRYQGLCFVGPARSGKTMGLILGGIAYAVLSSPGDVLVVQMSKETARDFSLTDLDRAIRNSPELKAALSPRARDDNTFDKFFRNGMRVKIGWPAISQLSSKTLKYVLLTDYDRPENRDDVDGEGPLWMPAFKRIQTYMSSGKCVAESSPEAEYLDAQWKPKTPHEAPPARGILEVYNWGTRGRWYWLCLHCGEPFQALPGLECFALPAIKQLEELVQSEDHLSLAHKYAKVVCPSCGGMHEQKERVEMSRRGAWVHEGERLTRTGKIEGERRGTNIISWWLGGVAAIYQSWESMLLSEFQALASFLRTGDEASLKFTRNTDQAAAYIPRAALNRRSTDELQKRLEDLPKGKVPHAARFLTSAIDVQPSKFVVEVFAWGVGLESWLIDRYAITSSKRAEGNRTAALEPAAYLEDWDILTERVIEARYPVVGSDQTIGVTLTVCDSGGKAGVTGKAYAFWRWLKARRKHRRFRLVKGASSRNAATIAMTWPDTSDRKDRKQGGRGDVPVYMLNTNILKDTVVGDLARTDEGPGFVHLGKWLDDDFFKELAAEQRTDKGWRNPTGARNEAFDLHGYNRAAVKICRGDRINWAQPPTWARPIAEREKPAPQPPESTDEAAEPSTPDVQQEPVAEPPRKQRPPRIPRRGWVKGWRH